MVDSVEGVGTTFTIYLPKVMDEVKDPANKVILRTSSKGPETLLVVEDEVSVRRLAVRILKTHGYNVIEVESPEEAIEFAERKSTKLDILLTDVIMPKMNGRELYEEISKEHSKLKVIYMSGYPHNVVAPHGIMEEEIDFLQKPFSVEELTDKVRKVLNR